MAVTFISRREGDPAIKLICDTLQELNDAIGFADVGDLAIVNSTSLYWKEDNNTWTQLI